MCSLDDTDTASAYVLHQSWVWRLTEQGCAFVVFTMWKIRTALMERSSQKVTLKIWLKITFSSSSGGLCPPPPPPCPPSPYGATAPTLLCRLPNIPNIQSRLCHGDFSGSSHTSDLKIGTPIGNPLTIRAWTRTKQCFLTQLLKRNSMGQVHWRSKIE